VIPSVQGSAFYTAWNSNIAWISEYVANGGRLWQSTCNLPFTAPEPLIPGWVVSSDDDDDYSNISDPGHRWVQGVPNPIYGTSASHDSYSNLYAGSHVVATAQTSGKPVLVDYAYGAGRVLITGQPLEYSWSQGQDAGPILENSLVNLFADVLILQDVLPWGTDSIQQVLENFGLAYETVDSTQFGSFDLTPYMMVVSPSYQNDTYYTPWNANITWISEYVADGGQLWQSTCRAFNTVEPLIPGGVVSADDLDYYNDIVDPGHPWVYGVPSPMYDNYASHDSFSLLFPGSHVVATAQTSGKPVLVDYEYGSGRVLLTGQALEWAWLYGNDGAPILENSIEDMLLTIFADGFETGNTSEWSSAVP
jgi:hypothetical protein